jgi:hypothetical protein
MPWTGTILRCTLETQLQSKLVTLIQQGEKGISLCNGGYHSIRINLLSRILPKYFLRGAESFLRSQPVLS